MITSMPVLSVPIHPETKILLELLSTLRQESIGQVIGVIASAYVQSLPDSEAKVVVGLKQAALARVASNIAGSNTERESPVATYTFSRLCFKRDVIEALGPNDVFRVETPIGVFQMKQSDFRRVFPNVTQSRSYVEDGLYHYRKLPSRAEQFLVTRE